MFKGLFVHGNLIFGTDINGEPLCQIERTDANDFQQWDVDPDAVGQYTGLKDKNGVEIYEGDILRENGQWLFEVKWQDKWGKFDLKSIKHFQYPEWNRGIEMEIIGNIHQNPELL